MSPYALNKVLPLSLSKARGTLFFVSSFLWVLFLTSCLCGVSFCIAGTFK